MLELIGVSKTFRTGFMGRDRKIAVDQASFQLREGEILGLVGESGCGKSTLGRMAVRLLAPSSGRIVLDGRDVTDMPERKFRECRRRVQIVFQHPESALDPHFTLRDSIRESFDRLGVPKGERQAMLERLADEVSLPTDILDRHPGQVSGGEIQRAVLARVFAFDPRYLVLDEPTSMLDVSVQAHILQLLKRKAKNDGTGMLFISHDLEVIRAMCDRVIIMRDGKITEAQDTGKLFAMPANSYTIKWLENGALIR